MDPNNRNSSGTDGLSRNPAGMILLSLTLSVLALLTTAINSLVISAIIVTRKLHHPANYLICSLAVTDLLVAILVMPFSIVYIVKETWVMGEVMCTIWLSVDITCCTCSILHLAAIAVDRYRAITDAVEYSRKRTSLRAAVTISVVWFLSILISLPPMVWGHHKKEEEEEQEKECLIKHENIAFTLYSTFGAFYIPLTLILILYYKIYQAAKILYHKRRPSPMNKLEINGNKIPMCSDREQQSHDVLTLPEKSMSEPSTEGRISAASPNFHLHSERSIKRQRISGARERKAAMTLGLILGAFVICWLPFFIQEVISNICKNCIPSRELTTFLTWLGYLNSLINPLIYTIFNEDFKKAFHKLIKCRKEL
ncbi:hypothetical protein Q7C36_008831 [Tachysurus vachellii]|uniref:G-protein coupled receptors family 1 profile domain-containing protein n=1 Tax=Tachysurus vachellii TaxID=175792 RepID=A0AA88N4S8_TACVA|nr:5-hydroxytryptamine receptor 1F [Tachysurus vachellii]XP_060733306.1 5-hydroxytryptamine receptor 1F [Tachysurus vachellii]KAK2850048.1 hypothetical protein Q7C36_008831 [Tachysurus vachellii]